MHDNLDNVIAFKYIVKDAESKEVLDNTYGDKPIEIILGQGQIHTDLEKEMSKMLKGEERKIYLEQPYGTYDNDKISEISKSNIGVDVEEGMMLYARGNDGRTQQVSVKSINDDTVVIDHNHPLAGKNLIFKIKVVNKRPASLEELQHGHIHSSSDSCGCGSGCGCH